MDSNIFSQIMSGIPSRNRAYSLSQAVKMGKDCLFLVLDARLHSTIPAEVFELKNLLVLSLEGMPIDELPPDICRLSQLKVLNLLACGVEQFPENMVDLHLEILWMSDGVLDCVPDFVFKIKSLKSLMINNYGIKKIPEQISQCSALKEISFCDNAIKKIPNGFYSLIRLKYISFSNNKIKHIKDRLGEMNDLRKIIFNYNSISNIPKNIGRNSRIHYLDFSYNQLVNIPDSIRACHLLSNLFLNNNSIIDIPEVIFYLPISHFNISRNKIKKIYASISNCRRLRILDISNNELQELPQSIYHLKQLEEINFNKNPIHHFPLGILGCDRMRKIKGWNKILEADIRKYIIPFIQSAYKNSIPFEERKKLFSLFIQTKEFSRKEAITLLNSEFHPFKKKAAAFLEKIVILSDIKNILFLGKFKQNKTIFYQKFIENKVIISHQHSKENTHIALGSGQYHSKINPNWKGTFVNEKTLIKLLNITPNQNNYSLSKSAIGNIKKLLSSHEDHIELALQLLNKKEIPNELITIIYFIMISNQQPNTRIKARNLIKNKINSDTLKFTKKDFNKEYHIYKILNHLKDNSLVNNKELAYYLFELNNKSWSFIYKNYDTSIFQQFKGIDLDLSFSTLNKIPKEIKNTTHFKSINLSNNHLKEITMDDIQTLNHFTEIDLSNNPIEFIHSDFFQMQHLRLLKLRSCNNIDDSKKANWITIFK